ncbi:MAG: TMEM165/GDT1 family protein [Elusimicrobiota bacterium]|nr:TMEM165/GDT1 family protein [Endomicrobiia bacterium]MDW8165413.1 TMEM165/GDT1 family protein [Elusimicrobiota bacterium]
MKEIITVFISMLFAEMADKTQLAIISFATKSSKPLNVWLAATLAFCFTNFLAVAIGSTLHKLFPYYYLKYISGVIFIIIGIVFLFSK